MIGQKSGRAFMARIVDTNGPPQEVMLTVPESERFTRLQAIAADNRGFVYVIGEGLNAQNGFSFVQEYDASMVLQYSVHLASGTSPRSIAVNAKGEALINGLVIGNAFATTPGAPNTDSAFTFFSFEPGTGFLVKLDSLGKVLVAARGVGVGSAAYDPQDNIYVVGNRSGLPTTPGAFQRGYGAVQNCASTRAYGTFFTDTCFYQHIAKLSPDGTQVLYSTYLTGSFGATTTALAVNAKGEAVVGGTTASQDYPTTPGSLIPRYPASANFRVGPGARSGAPPTSSGFISKLKADGSALVWSTYFSGTGGAFLGDMKILSDDRIAVAGQTFSKDLPGLRDIPIGCAPVIGRALPFVSTISGDGAKLISTIVPWELAARWNQVITGIRNASGDGSPLIAEGSSGLSVIASRQYIEYTSQANPNAVCFADASDWTLLGSVAPGQLVSIFGNSFNSPFVTFDGKPARILYSSPDQLNVQVPLDVTTGRDVSIRIVSGDRSIVQSVLVVQAAPSIFLASSPLDLLFPSAQCGNLLSQGYEPLALNENGGLHSCATPAVSGSSIVLFLNGLGAGQSPKLTLGDFGEGTLEFDPNLLLWKLRFKLLKTFQTNSIGLTIDGVEPRFTPLVIWIAQ